MSRRFETWLANYFVSLMEAHMRSDLYSIEPEEI